MINFNNKIENTLSDVTHTLDYSYLFLWNVKMIKIGNTVAEKVSLILLYNAIIQEINNNGNVDFDGYNFFLMCNESLINVLWFYRGWKEQFVSIIQRGRAL